MEWEEGCMPSSIYTKKANNILESICHSSLSSAIFNVFLSTFGISDTLQLFDDYRNTFICSLF